MTEIATSSTEPTQDAGVAIASVRLAGFSPRDTELLRLFLKRPTPTGATMHLVDEEPADLLIANMTQPEAVMAVRRRKQPGRTIGLVTQFATDAPYYQVQQNAQLLYSLAQGINRIREGWMPPHLAAVAEVSPPEATDAPAATDIAQRVNGALPQAATRAEAAEPAGEVSAPSARDQQALPWQRSLSILVVDDSKFSRVAIQDALGKVGFSVDTAIDGEEGLRMAATKIYDVALVDFEMPGIKGPEVLRRLRALGAHTPQLLIMLTSRTGAVDRLRAKIAGCDAYLTKPTKMSEFVSVLTQFAQQGRLKRG